MIIDIGSGPNPRVFADIRMDLHKWPHVNLQHDLLNVPYPIESNVADKIFLGDVIEHINKFKMPEVLKEIYRITKPGGVLDVTCPDIRWLAERIVNDDWNEKANVPWLHFFSDDPFENAMLCIFGGWVNPKEHHIPGMGHVNGFDEKKLGRVLREAGFSKVERVPDERNPEPARGVVLRMLAVK
ncbi:MAG: methyltransferase domain-containing protein [Alphaproteobacteria bacterium]|nr:methyltransferase domain-containing protein [Alphaproteobacteria bacterium]